MRLFNWLLSIGVEEEYPELLQQKIRITNIVAFAYILIALAYISIGLLFMPEIISYVTISGILFTSVFLLNFAGLFHLSRLISATNASVVCSLIHISILKDGDSLNSGLLLIQLSFTLLPWVIFDLKEKFWLFFTFLVTVLGIFLVKPLNYLIEPDILNDLLQSQLIQSIFILSACVVTFATLYLLQLFIQWADFKNNNLIINSDLQNKDLKQNELTLSAYIREIELKREEDRKREWVTTGVAQLSEVLRNTQLDVKEMYNAIILSVVKYLKLNQGALFIVSDDESERHLELVAWYAYERKKYKNKKFKIGEGLVGQCYLEKESIYMTQVPQHYTHVTSGLGEATPGCIFVLPLMVNENVVGIIELASFKELEPYEKELLDKVSESMGSTIHNIHVSEKTKNLLEHTMQQTEEMRAQEEEMRQNMEELAATQEEMLRKEKELNKMLQTSREKEAQMGKLAIQHREEVDELMEKLEVAEKTIKKLDGK